MHHYYLNILIQFCLFSYCFLNLQIHTSVIFFCDNVLSQETLAIRHNVCSLFDWYFLECHTWVLYLYHFYSILYTPNSFHVSLLSLKFMTFSFIIDLYIEQNIYVHIYKFNLLSSFSVTHIYLCSVMTVWGWITYSKKAKKEEKKEEEKNKRCMPKSTQKWTFLILTNLDVKGNIFSVKLVQSVT